MDRREFLVTLAGAAAVSVTGLPGLRRLSGLDVREIRTANYVTAVGKSVSEREELARGVAAMVRRRMDREIMEALGCSRVVDCKHEISYAPERSAHLIESTFTLEKV